MYIRERRITHPAARSSGALLVLLGVWGAIIPFVGPYFSYTVGSDGTWEWTLARFWMSVLPGAVTIVGGLMLMGSRSRAVASLGSMLALAAGAWYVVGMQLSRLWTDNGNIYGGPFMGSAHMQSAEAIGYFYGLGLVIAAFAAAGWGRTIVTERTQVEEREVPVTATESSAQSIDRPTTPYAGQPTKPVAPETTPRAASKRPLADEPEATPEAPRHHERRFQRGNRHKTKH